MAEFSMFLEFDQIGSGEQMKLGPIVLNATSEEEALNQAIRAANELYPALATRVLIRVLGSDGSGEAIAEIRRPREL